MLQKALPQQSSQYLTQVFGIDAVRPALAAPSTPLPYYLQDRYELWPLQLLGQPITLACVKGRTTLAAQQLAQHAAHLHELLQTPVIVALPQVTPGERKQLIAHGIAFVVPGKQLFAPALALILTERFGATPRQPQAQASPATQALLIHFLNNAQASATWHPFEVAARLGYTAMTATRAVRELVQFELFELEVRGRAKHLKLTGARRELWQKAKPHLRTPVQRMLWTYDQHILEAAPLRWAGESALAQMSMLGEPPQRVIAMTTEAVQQARQGGIVFEPREIADGVAVQVWRYAPDLLADTMTVDLLSLSLSLQDSQDDRVQMALDELEAQLPW